MPRSNFGQKVIFWAFYRQSSNSAALVRPLRARARAGDRPEHTILAEYLCPTEPGSAETAPFLRGFPRKTIRIQITGDHWAVFCFPAVSAATSAPDRPGHTLE